MKKYIVMVSGGIGGAEKRFFDIFKGLVTYDKEIYLVLPSCLFNLISESEDVQPYLCNIVIVDMPAWSPIRFAWRFYNDVLKVAKNEDVFHYPLSPLFFLHLFGGKKFTISYCDCYKPPKLSTNNKNSTLQYIASFFSSKIDILSPDVFSLVKDKNPYLKEKISLTPGGTYIYPTENRNEEKERKLVFLSRLEPNKGVEVLFSLLPKINEQLSLEASVRFEIYGLGSLSDFVTEQVEILRLKGINIDYLGYGDPKKVLPTAWVVFSLQEVTNYPSRVVAESLLEGCEVIILDTGDSRRFGDKKGISYLDEKLENIEEIVNNIIERSTYNNIDIVNVIKNEARCSFSSSQYISYFYTLLGGK
ncbi:glycosyltransferase [Vibrio sp. J383]|uniref:glycosyltransferase n=1 Tax=Vibrio sp. J383 TaxID=2942997 RepID=UPI000C827945|nr:MULTISPECIES: glycosyltransferase [Vibrio]PMH62635.1 hypothetical protein BCU64_12045 [Vibrio lentus]UQV21858.1 glycosyltransferase [Vibrio sp. J383]